MIWEWYLPAFMTLAGIGAFLYLFGVYFDIKHGDEMAPAAKFAIYLSWMVLAVASLFILLDLGKPGSLAGGNLHILGVFNRWPSSPLSLETSMLMATMGFGLLATLFYLSGWKRTWPRYLVEVIGAVPALFLAFGYAGFLELGAYTTNPLWHTPFLGLVTMVLAVLGAAALINLPNVAFFGELLPNFACEKAAQLLGTVIKVFLVLALALVVIYLLVIGRNAGLLVGGIAGIKFWTALILGLGVPLALSFVKAAQNSIKWMSLAQVVLIVMGAYLTNLAVIQAGQLLL